MSEAKPVIIIVVAFSAGAGVQVCQVVVPDSRYCNVYPVTFKGELHASVMELAVWAMVRKLAGADTKVVAFVVAAAEPLIFLASNRKSYALVDAKLVMVAVVALTFGDGVHVSHVNVPDAL